MIVLFLPEIRSYFEELSVILYQKEYFGFFKSALQYADELFAEIEYNLPYKSKKIAPEYFERYGQGMFMPLSKEIETHPGMCSSIYTIQKEKRFFSSDM